MGSRWDGLVPLIRRHQVPKESFGSDTWGDTGDAVRRRERMAALERQAVAVSGTDVGGSRSLPVRFHRSTVVSFASEGDYVVIRELGSTVRSNVNILPTVQHEVAFAQRLATLYPAGMSDEELSEDEQFGEQLMAWHKETVESWASGTLILDDWNKVENDK